VNGRKRLRALLDDDADEMDDHVGAAGELFQGGAVSEASGHQLHTLLGEEARPRRVARQRSDTVSAADECRRDVSAYETRASRQGNKHRKPLQR